MVEPPAAITQRPIGRAVAPPGEITLGRRDEAAPQIDPVVRRAQPFERRHLDLCMADHVEQGLVAPHVAFERRNVEIADDQSRLSQLFRPACHPLDEVELLPELGVERAVGDVAACGYIDIFQPDAAIEPRADMARLAIVLPVMAPAVVKRQARQDRHAMMHFLPIEFVVNIAARMEQRGGKDDVLRLGFLQAENVGLLLVEQALDDAGARAHRIDVPGNDLEHGHVVVQACKDSRQQRLLPASPRQATKRPPLRGHGARADQA